MVSGVHFREADTCMLYPLVFNCRVVIGIVPSVWLLLGCVRIVLIRIMFLVERVIYHYLLQLTKATQTRLLVSHRRPRVWKLPTYWFIIGKFAVSTLLLYKLIIIAKETNQSVQKRRKWLPLIFLLLYLSLTPFLCALFVLENFCMCSFCTGKLSYICQWIFHRE